MRPKRGQAFSVLEATGRALTTGMPCVCSTSEKERVTGVDAEGNDRIFYVKAFRFAYVEASAE